MQTHRLKKQQGATAIEFSIVFALLFAIFWAIISYAMPFFLYQTMNHAVAEAARQVVKFEEPTVANVNDALMTELNRLLPTKFVNSLQTPYFIEIKDENLIVKDDDDNTTSNLSYKILIIRVTYPGCNTSTLRSSCIAPALNLIGASIPNLGPYTAETKIRLSRNSS
ncbi:MAG: TadE family protein [Moraxellaceae bacterium]|nr:TadE family protein [Moraxellaceae bacterium]MDZ4387593.1 TadE family protein [Moraxellaceae bacterium]